MAVKTKIDPFSAEIIRESLVAVAEEMFISLQRTSQSTIIYEVLDFACGITDSKAQLIAQTNGVTAFAGILTFTVQSVLDKFGPDQIREGDIFATNDPYTGGGTHLSDVAMVMPLFYKGELLAFAANKAHWTEVGFDLARLPKGVFEAEDFIDDDGLTPDPTPIKVKVTIPDDEFTADFTGSAPQARGPVNCTRTGLMGGMRTIFKALTNPDTPVNEGCF